MPREILVVDDEPKICGALKVYFEEKGFHVAVASTAQAALEQIPRHQADVVLLDLRLQDGSGLDVLSRIKAQFPQLRVVVISALTDQDTIQEALHRGASTYLTKPFEFSACFFAAMGLQTVDLTTLHIDPEMLRRVPPAVAKQYQVIPVRMIQETLYLAMGDPFDVQRLDELKMLLACEIEPLGVVAGDIEEAIQRWYGVGAEVTRRPEVSQPPVRPLYEAKTQLPGMEPAGIVRLVNDLVVHACSSRATDLHLGIGPQGPWVRERIDGVLYDVPIASQFAQLYSSVVSRIKVMANMDIAEHRMPQDGRIWFDIGATKLDLRISSVPTPHGESLAIRLLEPSLMLRLGELGLSEPQLQFTETLLTKPTGLLLVTGPTGSGKSTSLYAFLSQLNTGRVNIVTLEDPIEHELSGTTQIQVQPKVGLTFATGLRSMLRHDPDIIMVGEIRDQETANLAVRAALTGHLVLSTIHTNDAASGITRLLDLGIEPFLLCSTLTGVLSQRLLRRLCLECRTGAEVAPATLEAAGVVVPAQPSVVTLYQPQGCARCRHSGYHGRTGVFEILMIDHHIRSLMLKRVSSAQIRQSAISKGMASLWHMGWQQVQEGLTSLEELIRVLPQEAK